MNSRFWHDVLNENIKENYINKVHSKCRNSINFKTIIRHLTYTKYLRK